MKATAKKQVPFVDLKAQYATIKDEVDQVISRVVSNTAFILGPEAVAFEQTFADYTGFRHVIGVGNGTDAIQLALRASGLERGQEVVAPAHTFIATTEGIGFAGGRLRLADVSEATFNMSARTLGAALTPDSRWVVPVAIYGNPAGLDEVLELANRRGLRVLLDAAQAHGARLNGKRMGELVDLATYSFYPGKNLGAYGDAGAVATNDDSVAQRLRMWRDHGSPSKYVHDFEGFNSRLDGIQAAVLRVKLAHLDDWSAGRRRVARLYREALAGLDGIRLPEETDGAEHVYHLYVIRAADRDRLRDGLGEHGVASGIHYPSPIHLLGAYAGLGQERGSFPVAEKICDEILSLPMYPEMGHEEVNGSPRHSRRLCADLFCHPVVSAPGGVACGCDLNSAPAIPRDADWSPALPKRPYNRTRMTRQWHWARVKWEMSGCRSLASAATRGTASG